MWGGRGLEGTELLAGPTWQMSSSVFSERWVFAQRGLSVETSWGPSRLCHVANGLERRDGARESEPEVRQLLRGQLFPFRGLDAVLHPRPLGAKPVALWRAPPPCPSPAPVPPWLLDPSCQDLSLGCLDNRVSFSLARNSCSHTTRPPGCCTASLPLPGAGSARACRLPAGAGVSVCHTRCQGAGCSVPRMDWHRLQRIAPSKTLTGLRPEKVGAKDEASCACPGLVLGLEAWETPGH